MSRPRPVTEGFAGPQPPAETVAAANPDPEKTVKMEPGNSVSIKSTPWYKTRACIISSIIIGLIFIGAAIAVGVLLASYLQGQPSELPSEALSCASGCYTMQQMAEIHEPWDRLLRRVVSTGIIDGTETSVVDYASVDLSQTSDLSKYLDTLASLDLTRVPEDEGLALLINAYNAFTVHLIASNLDGLTSIQSLSTLPFPRTTWNTRTFQLGGMTVTLDDIEHGTIRSDNRYNEPRIHAAVNCASVSCPDLRPEAYTGAALDQQLEEQMASWINNPNKGMFLDRDSNKLYLSSLFNWYGNDFAPMSVAEAACRYSNEGDACQYIMDNNIRIEFLPYNWGLNSLESATASIVRHIPEAHPMGTDSSSIVMEVQAAEDAGPHADWDLLLKRVVFPGMLNGVSTNVVDYTKLDSGNDKQLQAYMEWLASADIASMTRDEQLATLINAYNAFTLFLIAESFNDGDLESILNLENGNPWDSRVFELAGRRLTLNQIEHGWIRGDSRFGDFGTGFSEARIHAAVNCASVSCPDLRAEAYTANRLQQQLEEQMTIWLNNEGKGLELDASPDNTPVLLLSQIFQWYGNDFISEEHPRLWDLACTYHRAKYAPRDGGQEVGLCEFLDAEAARQDSPLQVDFLTYDWDLNHAEITTLPPPAPQPSSPPPKSSFTGSSESYGTYTGGS